MARTFSNPSHRGDRVAEQTARGCVLNFEYERITPRLTSNVHSDRASYFFLVFFSFFFLVEASYRLESLTFKQVQSEYIYFSFIRILLDTNDLHLYSW